MLSGAVCQRIVRSAVEMGYSLLDTASVYENHRQIAEAIKGFDREKLCIVSKIWIEKEVEDSDILGSIRRACDKACRELGTDYLDLYLIHWPNRSRPLEEMLEAMHQIRHEGKIRFVGVSNFTQHHLQDAYDAGIEVACNQVEVHPLHTQVPLVDFASSHGTKVMAYRPFGKGEIFEKAPLLAEIGRSHGKSAAQVAIRWFIQRKIPVIPKASREDHLRENWEVFSMELTEQEMAQISKLNQNYRTCDQNWSEFDY